jgi:protein-L-isoaspartate(D-aspartate) O-methyltransferase
MEIIPPDPGTVRTCPELTMKAAMDRDALLGKWKQGPGPARLLEAMERIPRQNFTRSEDLEFAWEDRPLPIGMGQTISQPSTVYYMLQLLAVESGCKVMEIGAGCGYQLAILSALAGPGGQVLGFEYETVLAQTARRNLDALKLEGLAETMVAAGDASLYTDSSADRGGEEPILPNLPAAAGYWDRIIAACGASEVPQSWLACLAEGGVLVAPVGRGIQVMQRWIRKGNRYILDEYGSFRFVPLRGRYE